MPKGKKLSNEQIGRVKAYFEMGISKNCIAQLIGQKENVCKRFLKQAIIITKTKAQEDL